MLLSTKADRITGRTERVAMVDLRNKARAEHFGRIDSKKYSLQPKLKKKKSERSS